MGIHKTHFFSPSRTIFISMSVAIAVGTFLLALPFSRTQPIPFIDLLFTATSCTCVTGLLTVPLENFTPIGQAIIMMLIQIGGLGLITLTFFVVSLFVNLGLSSQVMAGEMLDLDSWKHTKKILLFIIGLTAVIELLGAFFIFQTLQHDFTLSKALFYSLFQSISAFCNAGITPFAGGMVIYSQNYNMLLVTSLLMICGGLGFITWRELATKFNPWIAKKRTCLSLQTKIVLWYYFFFAIAGTFVFWLLEHNNTFEGFSGPLQCLNAFFTSVTSRSGGYLSVHPDDMQHASIFTIMINSFIGSAPGSTGGGIKLTTAAIFIATINAAIMSKTNVDLNGRTISKDQVYRALAIVSLSIVWVVLTIFCLLITENSWPFLDIVFEVISAFSTLGASIGITPHLSIIGKLLIAISMFIGRVGSLTLLIALRKKNDVREYTYPEERVMVT
jgi:trk system potassium uptake protein TrkH